MKGNEVRAVHPAKGCGWVRALRSYGHLLYSKVCDVFTLFYTDKPFQQTCTILEPVRSVQQSVANRTLWCFIQFNPEEAPVDESKALKAVTAVKAVRHAVAESRKLQRSEADI